MASDAFEITPDYLIESFVIIYSENGSNNRTKEEAVVFLLFDYISDCKGIDVSKILHKIFNFKLFLFLHLTDRKDVSLSLFLKFFTGAAMLPACGFSADPKICFTSDESRLPLASTCDLSITFPRSMGLLSENEFKTKLDFCILGSAGFDQV